MKIKILIACAGINFSFYEGEIVELSDVLAKDLIQAGYAIEIKEATAPKRGGK